MLKQILALVVLSISLQANAVVLTTLQGIEYEWLKITATTNFSREQIESRLLDVNDALYGYQYASRSLTQDLLLSYAAFDSLNGHHQAASVVSGMSAFIADFGIMYESPSVPIEPFYSWENVMTVDGSSVDVNGYIRTDFYYGTAEECNFESGPSRAGCLGHAKVFNATDGSAFLAWQHSQSGWDASVTNASSSTINGSSAYVGSLLVRPSAVPVPSALWLMGSALIGMVAVKRKQNAKIRNH